MVTRETYDFLDRLEASRDAVISGIQAAGGIDLGGLNEPERGNSGNGVDFFSLDGVFFNEIPVGLKRYKINSLLGYYSTVYANDHSGFTLDIATMRLMGLEVSKWAGMLPGLHYELIGDDAEPVGIITEDFSEHGKLRYSGNTWLNGYPQLFENPDIVDDDHLKSVVGIFENYRKDPERVDKRRIMDVYPLYDTSLMYDEEYDYVSWFADRLDLTNVASRIDGCRIPVSELAK